MYIYRPTAFNAQVHEKAGLEEQVDRLCRELATMPLEQVLSRFERVYPYLKRKESNLRLIARIRRIGTDPILCWLRVFRRGDRDYEEFLRDRTAWANHALDSQIPDQQLWQWLNQQKSHPQSQNQQTRPLDESLRRWLDRPSLRMDFNGVVIYESEAWLQRFATPLLQTAWQTFNRIITTLVDAPPQWGQATPWPGVRHYSEEGYTILYSRITTSDRPPRQVLFLIAPFTTPPQDRDILALLEPLWQASGHQGDINPDIFNPDIPTNLDALTTIARRAYPDYLLADETHWLEIENDERANLALSAEEEAILHAVSTQKPSLPLFLNGQAGSGKSTMLFHLFADYCHRHLRYCQDEGRPCLSTPRPLFLAYNDRLLKMAKARVIPLLASHHRFLARRGHTEDLPDISPFFQSFRTFLRNRLPLAERNRFNDANYVSFHQFRQQYLKTLWRTYSPEVCWQVIRTFIKGYHLDERDTYLDVEDYREIPRKEQSVSVEDFDQIYQTVWKWYCNHLKEQGKWDDQDLIRRVLQLKSYQGEFTAIFCDEAQDFTHLELQLIMRLSVFSEYDLEHQHVESLPFAFAGDPLQTLNPTGFRWASLKAAFYNEVITTLSPTGMLDLEMNFAELESNYRSAAPIVGVNNLIQLWRSVLFDIPELQPQRARRSGEHGPQKWIIDQDLAGADLPAKLQETIIIIPCDQGGEEDYIRRDALLSSLPPRPRGAAPWNILSAIAAKGLEFKQVVLYKFGEACPRDVWQAEPAHPEEARYFFNKLYVASSRATEQLVIVDTQEGDRRLWQHASNLAELDQFLAAHPQQRERWAAHIQLIASGQGVEPVSADDVEAIARTLAQEGIHSENADLMYRAQAAYERLGDHFQAALSGAWGAKFEEQYREAGQQFAAQGEAVEAWNCFWLGACWDALKAWYQHFNPQEGEGFERAPQSVEPLVLFMAAPEKTLAVVDAFTQFLAEVIAAHRLEDYRFTGAWQTAIQTYQEAIAPLCETPLTALNAPQWQQWGQVLAQLGAAEYAGMDHLAGHCFYQAGDYGQALAAWDRSSSTDTPEYHHAQAEIQGFPAALPSLAAAAEYDQILAAWGAANCPQTADWLESVVVALQAGDRWREALEWGQILDDAHVLTTIMAAAQAQNQGEMVLAQLIRQALAARQWQGAIAWLERYPDLLKTPAAKAAGIIPQIVQSLAHTPLEGEDFSRDLRRRYEQWFKDQVLFALDWHQPAPPDFPSLTMTEIGIALERLGAMAEALNFYDQFIQDAHLPRRDFARERWLVVKKKQEQLFSNQGKIRPAVKARTDLSKKAQQWQWDLGDIGDRIPHPPRLAPAPSQTAITGLPPEITLTPLDGTEGYSFAIHALQIRVLPPFAQVQIFDPLTQGFLRIDGRLGQISSGAFVVRGGFPFEFEQPSCGYRGTVHPDHLELAIAPHPTPILIHWPEAVPKESGIIDGVANGVINHGTGN